MKPRILVISSNLEIGGIERSLLGLFGVFDYQRFDVDLVLYRHEGPFMAFLPNGPRLLPPVPAFSAFDRPMLQVLKEGHVGITLARLVAKFTSQWDARRNAVLEPGYLASQRSWRLAIPFLPRIEGKYDLAISFCTPHYTVLNRVNALIKIGWIHTDYRQTPNDGPSEERMWQGLDKIAAVSEECRDSFLEKFPKLTSKTLVIENVISMELVRRQSREFTVEKEMSAEPGVTRVLTVGRFSHPKAFDQAVLSCRRLNDLGTKVHWYAIGYGPDERMIRELISANKLEARFTILGKKVNPYPYMSQCDLYVQPSRYEGKAVTVREAQILGKPVLITRFPTSGSQLEDGVDGLICEMGVDGIVAGVKRMIEDRELREGLAARAAGRDYSNSGEIGKLYSLVPNFKS